MNRNKKITSLLLFVITIGLNAQNLPSTPDIWEVQSNGHVFENFEGKPSLYLFQGVANLKSPVDFKTGIIEYSIFVTERRGFPGVHFRVGDNNDYEEFYIRPHQSGNPDANQYTPVFNGISGWQLYYGKGNAQAINYNMNEWNHIKLVIAEKDAEVYINNMEIPLFYIPELKIAPRSGTIRLSGGGPSPFHFADLKVTKIESPKLKSERIPLPEISDMLIKSWAVSNSFPESNVASNFMLSDKEKSNLRWNTVTSESAGYANLARVAQRANGNNTVFAKVIITSETDQIKKMVYGFSDRARIYLNDQILAGGTDNFVSRDYRFLGTMGFFDAVYLPLKKGKNELWIAVSENFGGWGVMAGFENKEGIKLD